MSSMRRNPMDSERIERMERIERIKGNMRMDRKPNATRISGKSFVF